MKFFANLLIVFLTVFTFLGHSSAQQSINVPDTGSVWVSSLTYKTMNQDGPVRRRDEVATVTHLKDGRPVFSGQVFGYQGEILESSQGTVVYTDKCKESVPKEMLAPPQNPNQCVWHVCNPPKVGETFSRPMVIYTDLYACQPQVGTYTFTSKSFSQVNGKSVVVGDAKVDFGLFRKTSWESYIFPGEGEVYAVSPSRETVYSKVIVKPVSYAITLEQPLQVTVLGKEDKKEIETKCDLVAFGDSLTEGMGASKEESYPARLSELLGKKICNFGISGNTTEIAKERISSVIELHPKVVFITLGANDVFQGVTPKVTKKNLEFILESFLKENIIVVVLGYEGVFQPSASPYMTEMLSTYGLITSNRENVIYLPKVFVGVLDSKETMSADGLHPNAAGYKKLAGNVFEQGFGILSVLPSGN